MAPDSDKSDRLHNRLESAQRLVSRDVSKEYASVGPACKESEGQVVLRDVNMELNQDSIIGLAGKTGAGKTTMGKILGGLLRPDRGTVTIGDIDLFDCSPDEMRSVRKWLRYVPQNPDAVLPHNITVTEALEEARKHTRLKPDEHRQWLQMIGNTVLYDPSWANRSIGDLSLGQRRRIVNLRSLQACPKFLIFDEPFNGLDIVSKFGMLALLQACCWDKQTGVLLISHDVEVLKRVCQKIYRLENGILSV